MTATDPRRHPSAVAHAALAPLEVLPPWRLAQRTGRLLTREPVPEAEVLRAAGQLPAGVAERIAAWFTEPARRRPGRRVRAAYMALAADTAQLFGVATAPRASGGLGVTVELVRGDEPYGGADGLCADLRERGSMRLRTIACDAPHPLLDSTEGGTLDQLRVVHDVFGHAALGLGFDLQSEFATWLWCGALFGPQARGAAFTELVGAVTAFVGVGLRPALRADLAPARLRAACEPGAAIGLGRSPR